MNALRAIGGLVLANCAGLLLAIGVAGLLVSEDVSLRKLAMVLAGLGLEIGAGCLLFLRR
jgi:hypothetical protein